MQAAQKSWSVAATGAGRTGVRVVIGAIVTAITAAYVVLLFHPRLIRAAEPTFSAWGIKPAWVLALTAAVAIVGAASLCFLLLAGIARGVQRAPYVWSAPVLLGMAGVALARMPVQLPIPAVPVPLFAACTSMLLLVGGALLQLRGWPAKVAGALILSLPLLSVAGADSLTPQSELATWAGSAGQGRGFVLVLCASWLATIALALIARPVPREAEELRTELRDPIAGAEWVPGKTRSDLFLGAVTLLLLATLAGSYSWVYLPLVRRVSAQQAMLAEAGSAQTAAVDAQRVQFERELASLRAKLEADRRSQTSFATTTPASLDARGTSAALTPVSNAQRLERLPQGLDVPPSSARAQLGSTQQRPEKTPAATARTSRRTIAASKAAPTRRKLAHAHRTRTNPPRRAQAPSTPTLSGPVAADDDPIGGLESAL